ncbi:Contactin-1 [Orchesella cincta]|uniref:Contactin-1 n=1 Tax=Orchesella cincta TaxID=48709 RepID=A0A1D2N9Y1_ORCCI|nr:Contactin-1 [Orchesella cincta]
MCYLRFVFGFTEKWSETAMRRKSTSGDQNSLVVSGLLPAVTYHFRLQARNQLGTSEPTQVFEVSDIK